MIEETDEQRNIEILRKGARVLWDLGGLPTFSPAAIAGVAPHKRDRIAVSKRSPEPGCPYPEIVGTPWQVGRVNWLQG